MSRKERRLEVKKRREKEGRRKKEDGRKDDKMKGGEKGNMQRRKSRKE